MTDQEFEPVLRSALRPSVSAENVPIHGSARKDVKKMHISRMVKRIVLAAAVLALMVTTAFAAGAALRVSSIMSASDSKTYNSYSQMERACRKADFHIDTVENFSNGFNFESVRVQDNNALDEDGKVMYSFCDFYVTYRNASGGMLILCAQEKQEEMPKTDAVSAQTVTYGDIPVTYTAMHYKTVPEDYELTAEDIALMEDPNYEISYGSDFVMESEIQYVNWEKEGICYSIMDMLQTVNAEEMLSMAGELITNGR